MGIAPPEYAEWIRARMQDVPLTTSSWCGEFAGLEILDVGCGDMFMDMGLLMLNPAHITGLDIRVRDFNVIAHAAREVSTAGYAIPGDYATRLKYVTYDGKQFPFADDSFDLVFSWGVFEHIADPRIALSEARRVVRPGGRIFIVVWPWFPSYRGSHLVDYISEPYFQFHRSDDWVWNQLNDYLENHPEEATKHLKYWRPEGYTLRSFLLEVMWNEYRTLNRYSARRFFRDAIDLGLVIERMESQIEEHPAARSVPDQCYADLISAGSTVLFRPGKSPFSA